VDKNVPYVINNQILVDINILRNKILNKNYYNKMRDYNQIIMHLKYIVSKIIIHYGESYYNELENKDHLCNPNIIFDPYFLDENYQDAQETKHDNDISEEDNYALNLCDEFENVYTKIQNRIDEYDFDLSTYGECFEKQMDILLYHYSK